MPINLIRQTYLDTADAVATLLGAPEIAARWDEDSVLESFKVSGLAGHLARAVLGVDEYLGSMVGPGTPISAAQYFNEFDDLSDIDSSVNLAVRDRGDEIAAAGAEQLVEDTRKTVEILRGLFETEGQDRRVQVFHDRILLLDEYLKTRLVEMVIHAEDLALSTGTGVGIPVDAIAVATDTIVATGRARHGDLAFLRGMTRRERDDLDATRVI